MAFSNQNALKCNFRQLKRTPNRKILQGSPSEIWSRIFWANKIFFRENFVSEFYRKWTGNWNFKLNKSFVLIMNYTIEQKVYSKKSQ